MAGAWHFVDELKATITFRRAVQMCLKVRGVHEVDLAHVTPVWASCEVVKVPIQMGVKRVWFAQLKVLMTNSTGDTRSGFAIPYLVSSDIVKFHTLCSACIRVRIYRCAEAHMATDLAVPFLWRAGWSDIDTGVSGLAAHADGRIRSHT